MVRQYASLMRGLVSGIILITCAVSFDAAAQGPQLFTHPYMFFTAADIAAMTGRANTTHLDIWDPIQQYVDVQVGNPPPPLTAPVNGTLEQYRDAGLILPPIALACVITGDPDYCDLGRTYLLRYAGWTQWGEQDTRSLGLAHMVMGNALAYDWLFNYLTPTEQQTVADNLAMRAQELYEASSSPTYEAAWNNWWSLSYMQNHYAVLHSALGVAGLALFSEDSRAVTWVDHAITRFQRLQHLLEGIGDGTWHESIPYQAYMMATSLQFLTNLRRLHGVDLIPHNYYQAYTYWRLYNLLPNTTRPFLTYGDFEWSWGNSRMPQHLLRFAAAEYGDPYAEWTARQIIAADGRNVNLESATWYTMEFFYYDPAIQPLSPEESLPPARDFSDFAGVIWRSGWSADDVVFGLHTGSYGGHFAANTFINGDFPWQQPCSVTRCSLNTGHQHSDANTFYFYAGGNWLAQETIGVGRFQTALHNTLLIDGQGQYRPPANRFGEFASDFAGRSGFIEASYSTANFMFVAADATQRYDVPDLNDFTRYVLFASPTYIIMVDRVAAAAPHSYDWVVHFDQDMILDGNWLLGNGRSGPALGMRVASPQPYLTTTGNDGTPYLRLRPAAAAGDTLFVNVLYPADDPAQARLLDAALVDNQGNAVAIRVTRNIGVNLIDDMLLSLQPPGAVTTVGDYSFDGTTALVSGLAPGEPQRLFVAGATALSYTGASGNRTLVQSLDPRYPFEAVFLNNQVAISGVIATQVMLYAPDAQVVTVNGMPASFHRVGDYIVLDVADNAISARQGSSGPLISKTANPPFALPGDPVTWAITVENPTGVAMNNIIMQDRVPDLLEITSVSASAGAASHSGSLVTLTHNSLGPGERITLTLETRVRSDVRLPFIITNTASVEDTTTFQESFAEATVLSVTYLPSTGQAPRMNNYLRILVVLCFTWMGALLMWIRYRFRPAPAVAYHAENQPVLPTGPTADHFRKSTPDHVTFAVSAAYPMAGIGEEHFSMEVSESAQDVEWDAFVERSPGADILQTSLWARVKAESGWQPTRLIVRNQDEIVGGLQLLSKRVLPGVRVGVALCGPLNFSGSAAVTDMLLAALRRACKENSIRFLFVQPPCVEDMRQAALPADFRRSSFGFIMPQATTVVDLEPDAETLLAQMRSKTRYNIRLGLKKGITVREGSFADVPTFHRLLTLTGERQGFSPQSLRYFEMMWNILTPHDHMKIFLAEFEGQVVSAALVTAFADTVVYKRGGWSGQHGNYHPNEVLHWSIMNWAKAAGYRHYDFDGIDTETARTIENPDTHTPPQNNSVTHFKLGFGGRMVLLSPMYEYVPNPVLRWAAGYLFTKVEKWPSIERFLIRLSRI